MSSDSNKKDLIVMLADLDAENAVKTLLVQRTRSLGIRNITFKTIRYPGRDSGCAREADEFLRNFQSDFDYAMVVFDNHGCGYEEIMTAQEIERKVETDLTLVGWRDRRAVIVLDPELEIWVWGQSAQIAQVLGWSSLKSLHEFLIKKGFLEPGAQKPTDPKAAMQAALREVKKQWSARHFGQLAEKVSARGCQDRAYLKFVDCLRRWFPAMRST